MHSAVMTFEILDEKSFILLGHKKVTCIMAFDVKIDVTCKAHWVLDGHKTHSPKGSTHAAILSVESVRILFTHGALNGFDIFIASFWTKNCRKETYNVESTVWW